VAQASRLRIRPFLGRRDAYPTVKRSVPEHVSANSVNGELMKDFPFNCQHCAYAILRNGRPVFRCKQCGSKIIVPPPGGIERKIRLGPRQLTIQSDNQPNRWGVYPYLEESLHEPLLQEFRSEFPIEEAYQGAKDEFDTLVNLRHMVRNVWFPSRPRGAFLKKYGFWQSNRLNKYWFCTHLSRMFVMSATALGIPARIINVARKASLHGFCAGHMVADIWSNQHQKWVYMDPLFDFHYENADGEPLDLLEARHLFWRKKAKGLFLCTLRGYGGCQPGRHDLGARNPDDCVKSLQERTLNTYWCLFYHGQNYFSRPVEERRVNILIYEDDLTKGKKLLGGGYEHYATEPLVFRTPSVLDIYPTMNNAEIQIYQTPQDGRDKVRVYISTTTPDLKRIRYRVGSGRWRTYGIDGFLVPLGRGKLRTEAQTENYAGRRGRESAMTLAVTKALR